VVGCSEADSVMIVGASSCGDQPAGTSPTINNSLPVNMTTIQNGSPRVCGFP